MTSVDPLDINHPDFLDGYDPAWPWPGDELALRVSGSTDREAFYRSGRRSVLDIERALAVVGRTLDSYTSVLDFGCGCGRILIWLRELAAKVDLHGVDIDARAIAWVQDNLPEVTAKVNQPLPPLDYPDGSFDLVYNHSVFTHIDEHAQDLWLRELWRVTRPGGHVLLTVHGEAALSSFEEHSGQVGGDDRVREQVRRRGLAFIKEDSFVGGPFPDSYHSTYHAPWYVLDHWADVFAIRAYVPQGSLGFQDLVLLERRDDDPPPRKPFGPLSEADRAESPAAAAFPLIEHTRALVRRGPDAASTSRWGSASRLGRRLVTRAIRHYDDHQREVQLALLEAFGEARAVLDDAVRKVKESLTLSEELTLKEANARLWEALRQQGERINRLETDLWEAVRAVPRQTSSGPPDDS